MQGNPYAEQDVRKTKQDGFGIVRGYRKSMKEFAMNRKKKGKPLRNKDSMIYRALFDFRILVYGDAKRNDRIIITRIWGFTG